MALPDTTAFWVGVIEAYANKPDAPDLAEALQYATATMFRGADIARQRQVDHYQAMAEEYRRSRDDR